jgi:hypothetical protein
MTRINSESRGDDATRRKPSKQYYDTFRAYVYTGTQFWALATGSSRCVCAGCGDGFNSVAAFDKHQRLKSDGRPICLDPETLGMARNAAGWWVTKLNDASSLSRKKGHHDGA